MSKLGKTIDEIFDGVVDEETVDGKISQALEDAKAYTDNAVANAGGGSAQVNLEKGEGIGSVQQKPYFDEEDGGEIKAIASGRGSFAFGKNTTATGTRAVAIGNNCNSAGNTAFTIGQDNTTGKEPLMDEDGNVLEWYGSASFTGGNVCTNYGNYTFLFGYKQIANANVLYCFSTGGSNTFLEGAQESGIFGSESKNASIRTYLFGQKNQSLNPSAVNSFTAGFNNTITSSYQFLFGDNLTPRDGQQQIVLGTRNVKDNNAILVVGNGGLQRWEEGYKYHNAFVVKRDGKVYGGELYLTEAENKLVNAKELSETLAQAKAYTDEELAKAGGGGLTEMEVDTKIENALIEAPLSNSQYTEVFDMIETYIPLHLGLNMQGYLSNAGAVLLSGSSWGMLTDDVETLKTDVEQLKSGGGGGGLTEEQVDEKIAQAIGGIENGTY